MLTEHVDDNLIGRIRWQHLTEEIIGLRGHYTEEGHRAQMLLKAVALCQELIASLQVVALVLVVDLHEELGKRVEVPDGNLFLDPRNQVCIGRGEDAETEAWHTKALRDALHNGHVGIRLENLVGEQGVVTPHSTLHTPRITKVHKALIDHQTDGTLLAPLRQPQHIGLGDEVA